ncbi:RNA-guided endonuclease TnpB family protein [Bacteroides sp. 51]|uniref:RNA-guided endonuclease InsQ/TnpB family protein n=1 Tax=Bacteroides sp. 51 TaxID=2302938 RepID=UPI0013D1F1BE|nr:RNA-guided endonuclease TnpB family protein [Bacteroides sp. 51]NDV84969.1 transposase [Bacteroides sp. 51]
MNYICAIQIMIVITVCYKYKVYHQNRNHEVRLSEYLRTASWIYNHCIALQKRYYKLYKKHIGLYKLQAHIVTMKKRCYPKWSEINSQSIQQITERIHEGYKRFFNHDAKHPPTFKSWSKYKSVTFKSTGYTINGNVLTINKQKLRLKFHQSRPITGKVQTVCLKRDSVGDWWVTFTCRIDEQQIKVKTMTGKTAGFDFGLKHFLTSSDGVYIESPLVLFHSLEGVRKKSRNLSRKQKGSNSRKKARLEIARLHRNISNRRTDFHWQLANHLVSQYDIICLETLNLNEMKKRWGRKISDLSFSEFIKILSHTCTKYGKKLVMINQWEATSKTCYCCGTKVDEMPLNVRKWVCPACETSHDRDVNAAKNILRVGTSTLGIDDVRPAKQAIIA